MYADYIIGNPPQPPSETLIMIAGASGTTVMGTVMRLARHMPRNSHDFVHAFFAVFRGN